MGIHEGAVNLFRDRMACQTNFPLRGNFPYFGFLVALLAYYMIIREGELFDLHIGQSALGCCLRFDGTELKT